MICGPQVLWDSYLILVYVVFLFSLFCSPSSFADVFCLPLNTLPLLNNRRTEFVYHSISKLMWFLMILLTYHRISVPKHRVLSLMQNIGLNPKGSTPNMLIEKDKCTIKRIPLKGYIKTHFKCTIQWFVVNLTELFHHYHSLILEHFHHPRDCSQSLFLLPAQAATGLLSVPMDLPILDISYKWNHIIYDLL